MRRLKSLFSAILALQLFCSILPANAGCIVSAANPTASKVTTLNAQELQKLEFSEHHKKDWAQRLQWFESKIIDHYKKLNKKNILVVGPQEFLDAFKTSAQKCNWKAKLTYTTAANSPKIAGGAMI